MDRKKLGKGAYMVQLVSKILEAESLLEAVGMAHWLRQEDKIPEYEDLLTDQEKLEWVRKKTRLTRNSVTGIQFTPRPRNWPLKTRRKVTLVL